MVIDRLYEKVALNGHVCVGLDTDYSYLPAAMAQQYPNIEDGLFEFNRDLIDATLDVDSCYKAPTRKRCHIFVKKRRLSSLISSAATSPRLPRCMPRRTSPAISRPISSL